MQPKRYHTVLIIVLFLLSTILLSILKIPQQTRNGVNVHLPYEEQDNRIGPPLPVLNQRLKSNHQLFGRGLLDRSQQSNPGRSEFFQKWSTNREDKHVFLENNKRKNVHSVLRTGAVSKQSETQHIHKHTDRETTRKYRAYDVHVFESGLNKNTHNAKDDDVNFINNIVQQKYVIPKKANNLLKMVPKDGALQSTRNNQQRNAFNQELPVGLEAQQFYYPHQLAQGLGIDRVHLAGNSQSKVVSKLNLNQSPSQIVEQNVVPPRTGVIRHLQRSQQNSNLYQTITNKVLQPKLNNDKLTHKKFNNTNTYSAGNLQRVKTVITKQTHQTQQKLGKQQYQQLTPQTHRQEDDRQQVQPTVNQRHVKFNSIQHQQLQMIQQAPLRQVQQQPQQIQQLNQQHLQQMSHQQQQEQVGRHPPVDETLSSRDIVWSSEIDEAIAEGYKWEDVDEWSRKVRAQRVRVMSKGNETRCGRSPNQYLETDGNIRLCARYPVIKDIEIQGELMSFYVARLLDIRSVPPVVLSAVDSNSYQWSMQGVKLKEASWMNGQTVALNKFIEGLDRTRVPKIINKKMNVAPLEVNSLELKTMALQDLTYLAQWSDLIVFDYIIGHVDRMVNLQVEEFRQTEALRRSIWDHQPVHNLAYSNSSSILWFLDNETGFRIGYRALYHNRVDGEKYKSFHDIMLHSVCIFRPNTVKKVSELYHHPAPIQLLTQLMNDHEPLTKRLITDAPGYLTDLPERFKSRIESVYYWMQDCRQRLNLERN